jgi:ABC-type uncharacterized transport system substrate-binding protein
VAAAVLARARTIAACGAAFLVLSALALVRPATAHPHVWVSVETTVVYDKGTIVGLRHKWTFDELYTAMAIEGLDKNNDGIYSREELSELAKVNLESLKEFDYFTQVRLVGQPLKVSAPTDYWLEHGAPRPAPKPAGTEGPKGADKSGKSGDKKGAMDKFWGWMAGSPADGKKPPAKVLSLHFFIPLEQPVLAEADGFTFEVTDPTFFIAFTLEGAQAVTIGAGAPPGCKANVLSAGADDGRRLGEGNAAIPEGGVAFVTGQTVAISCKGRP